jgi:hypothetical protein
MGVLKSPEDPLSIPILAGEKGMKSDGAFPKGKRKQHRLVCSLELAMLFKVKSQIPQSVEDVLLTNSLVSLDTMRVVRHNNIGAVGEVAQESPAATRQWYVRELLPSMVNDHNPACAMFQIPDLPPHMAFWRITKDTRR